MTGSELLNFAQDMYEKALAGQRILLTGDSFFIGVIEKQLINKLANSDVRDISLAIYRPALNAHFFSGGQIVVVDFFTGQRGLHQLQFVDNVDQIMVLESAPDSAKALVSEYIAPMAVLYEKVKYLILED